MGFRNGKPSRQFTPIPNSLIRDYSLTDSTFRLICWVASHDENFDISFAIIEKCLGYKRDKIRSAIKNAEQNDYLVRVRDNNSENGTFDWQYYIFTNKEDTRLFRENHQPTGGSSIGGSSIGGSSIGGSSTPYIEEQYEKKQRIKEQREEDSPHPQLNFNLDQENLDEREQTLLTQQPTRRLSQSQQLTSLSKNSESLHQTDKSSCGSIIPGSFDNHEQLNITDLPAVANQQLSSSQVAKLQKYQQLDADGIKLKQPELRDWAALEIAPYIRTYRKSGFILTGGNDISGEFAIYVAKQNCRKGQEPTIALGFNVINKCETDPRHWQKLVAWVVEWQQQRHTGQTANFASVVNQQEQLNRIRQAANTKFEL
ncbi:helix-turn-helix domain-containing protein [Halotia branconii]|uniref:Helix-turn-helix domain-containing protein n=1 Tax=Halotia branconii CENA392 TaxID=1539056 RepID=A0AAJ6PCR0_9CYAN|nr:helix-turn-helix domain-containing protein [Halotia branconii]WGV29127.1 helix-turn-helix domain-containing protein [Halotia branconii CENA392]